MTSSLRKRAPPACLLASFCSASSALFLELRYLAVGDLGRLLQIAAPSRQLGFGARLLDLLLDLGDAAEDFFFLLPLGSHGGGFFFQLSQLALEILEPLARSLVLFFLERLPLDLEVA